MCMYIYIYIYIYIKPHYSRCTPAGGPRAAEAQRACGRCESYVYYVYIYIYIHIYIYIYRYILHNYIYTKRSFNPENKDCNPYFKDSLYNP